MKVSLVFVLITLVSALAVSFGSVLDRSEKNEIPLLHPHRQHSADDADLNSSKQEKRGFLRQKRLFNVNRDARSTEETTLNVILLLVNDLGKRDISSSAELENTKSFPVQGVLQSCQENAKSCDCSENVNTNIAHLLSWADRTKEMTTSILYEVPAESQEKERIEAAPEHDSLHVEEVLKKVKESFSQTMLRNLEKNADGSIKPSLLRRINFRELASRTLQDLISTPSDKGFVLVATASVDEVADALEILRRHAFGENNLVVVSSMCPTSQGSVQFFARGPGSSRLLEAKEVSQVPRVLRDILNDYHCRISPEKCVREQEMLRTFVKRQTSNEHSIVKRQDTTEAPAGTTYAPTEPDAAAGAGAGAGAGGAAAPGGGNEGFEGENGATTPSSAMQVKMHQFSSVIFASSVLLAMTKIIKF